MKHVIDKNFYPGFVRKSITFSIDDGNVPMDRKFIEIMKPAGILGTFNLNSNNLGYMSREEYIEFYRDYGIANHCKYHPVPMRKEIEYKFTDAPFNAETSDTTLVHKHPQIEGLYRMHCTVHHPASDRKPPIGWSVLADEKMYERCADLGRSELAEFFGRDNIKSFVWPGGYQRNDEVHEYLRSNYRDVRKTGCTLDTTGFALPEDLGNWTYNAHHGNLLEALDLYEAYPDDGELKFFCIGVHSKDYEVADKWDDLRTFADRCGNRPETYYYASVEDIFDHAEAVEALIVTDDSLENVSDRTLYVKVDGVETIVPAHTKIVI